MADRTAWLTDTFWATVSHVLDVKKVTLKELSDSTGIPYGSLKNMRGCEHRPPSLSDALSIAKALNVSIDYLCGNSTRKESREAEHVNAWVDRLPPDRLKAMLSMFDIDR